MIAAEDYKANFNIWGQDYMHYYIEHAPEVYEWVKAKAALTRNQNTIGLRSSARSRINTLKKQMLQTQDEALIDDLLSGKIFQGMKEVSETELMTGTASISGYDEAVEILKNVDPNIDTLGDFSIALKNALNKIYDERYVKELFSKYSSTLIQEYADSNNTRTKNSTAKNIISGILGKYNHKFFQDKAQSSADNVHVDCLKILALIEVLPEVQLGKGKIEVRHGSQAKGKGKKVQGDSAVLTELKNKVILYLREMKKMTTEAALAAGFTQADYVGWNALMEGQNAGVFQTGYNVLDTNFDIDPKMKHMYEQTSIRLEQTQKKRQKGDVEIRINVGKNGQGNVTANAGITVKDYQNVTFKEAADGTFSMSGEIKLQDGTPLLTALAREASVSSNDIQKIAQFLVAHSLLGNETELDLIWEDLKHNLTQRMFLNALAGLSGTKDNAIFMAVNGKIFSLENIVDSFIRDSDSNIKLQESLGKSNEKTPELGLERSTYMNMNRWLGNNNNIYHAKLRSKSLYSKVYNKMANTKLKIMLNMHDMANLVQLNMK